MPLVCLHGTALRSYFNTDDVLKVDVPVDIAAGLKPLGWNDDYAAIITLRTLDSATQCPVTLGVCHAEWPDVRRVLCVDNAIWVNHPKRHG